MISTLRGTLTALSEDRIVLEVQQVGYEVLCPSRSIKNWTLEQPLFLHTYLSVKEDSHTLYGFESQPEKKAFILLLSVSGIGPKSASQLVDVIGVETLIQFILKGDSKSLSAVKGVGKKTAERLVLELKEKIHNAFGSELKANASHAQAPSASSLEAFTELEDAKAALMALGYKFREIQQVVDQHQDKINSEMSTEEIVKLLLQNFH